MDFQGQRSSSNLASQTQGILKKLPLQWNI